MRFLLGRQPSSSALGAHAGLRLSCLPCFAVSSASVCMATYLLLQVHGFGSPRGTGAREERGTLHGCTSYIETAASPGLTSRGGIAPQEQSLALVTVMLEPAGANN